MANNEEIGYNIREATSGDYEAVMAIDENIYDGYDHLSKLYHTYMRDPRRICFVLEIDRKVVSMGDGTYISQIHWGGTDVVTRVTTS